ncbi:MAG TPA: NmrA/HSCARG family protein [Caulobacteraceae bacterium]
MAGHKIIAVLGATGSQGAGLCEAILGDPDGGFACRALTRNPGSDKAKALEAKGAEVAPADLDDEASLAAAFRGAHGVFGVTNYPEAGSVEREQQQAANIAKAARTADAARVIWSTLDDTTQWLPLSDPRMPTLMGRYKVPHSDSKGQIDHVFTDLGLPTTFLLTCFYWDNFYNHGWGPTKGQDGAYALTLPIGKARMPGIAAEDIGKCAYAIFRTRTGIISETVGIAGAHLSGAEMAEKFSAALGMDCRFDPMSAEAYRNLGFPGADDLGNMFQMFDEFEPQYRASRSVDAARALAPSLMDFDTWLAKYKSRIPI